MISILAGHDVAEKTKRQRNRPGYFFHDIDRQKQRMRLEKMAEVGFEPLVHQPQHMDEADNHQRQSEGGIEVVGRGGEPPVSVPSSWRRAEK